MFLSRVTAAAAAAKISPERASGIGNNAGFPTLSSQHEDTSIRSVVAFDTSTGTCEAKRLQDPSNAMSSQKEEDAAAAVTLAAATIQIAEANRNGEERGFAWNGGAVGAVLVEEDSSPHRSRIESGASAAPSCCAATEGSTSSACGDNADAATLDSNSTFGSTASLLRTASLASQSSATNTATATVPVLNPQQQQQQHIAFREGSTFLIPPGSVLYRMQPSQPKQQQQQQQLGDGVAAGDERGPLLSHDGTFGSNLSLRAMYMHDDDVSCHQHDEYFQQQDGHSDDEEDDHHDHGDHHEDHDDDKSQQQEQLNLNDYTPPNSLTTMRETKMLYSRQDYTAAAMENTQLQQLQEQDEEELPPPASAIAESTSSTTAAAAAAAAGSNGGGGGKSSAISVRAAADQSASTFVVGSATSESTSGSLTGNNNNNRRPVLYSAIGSLEDPSNSSYKGWKNRAAALKKLDFPSSMLLAPPAQVAAKKKKKDALESSLPQQRDRTIRDEPNRKQFSQQQQQEQERQRDPNNKQRVSLLKNPKPSNDDDESKASSTKSGKKVTIASGDVKPKSRRSRKQDTAPLEMFRPSSDAYTPRMGKKEIKYKPAAMRTPVQQMASPLGTLSRPNFRDALRRVAMIIHQHIVKIERRFESKPGYRVREDDGLFSESMKDAFSEDKYIMPRYKCTMVRVPMARSGMVCGLKQIRMKYEIPSEGEIYEFAHRLFKSVQLSSECSIVGLIYVERLMEAAKVPLLAETWRPVFMCGLLLASKVWQDLSSWNIEFAGVYPQYSLESINRLELQFLRMVKWDLYISSSQYAKYYFALRSLVEKPDFRQRYNRMVGGVDTVQASQARKIEERSTILKEEALSHLSHSM